MQGMLLRAEPQKLHKSIDGKLLCPKHGEEEALVIRNNDAPEEKCDICENSFQKMLFMSLHCAMSACIICCSQHVRSQSYEGARESIRCICSERSCNWQRDELRKLFQISQLAHDNGHEGGMTKDELNACERSFRIFNYLQKPSFRWCRIPDCGNGLVGRGSSHSRCSRWRQ